MNPKNLDESNRGKTNDKDESNRERNNDKDESNRGRTNDNPFISDQKGQLYNKKYVQNVHKNE